jgi:hypothetical protein
MVLWKQKYPTLRYSEDQERHLRQALQPPIHSATT